MTNNNTVFFLIGSVKNNNMFSFSFVCIFYDKIMDKEKEDKEKEKKKSKDK
jgi:hypothetical protein